MSLFSTLHGVTSVTTASDGAVQGCMLCECNEVPTVCGCLIPKWGEENVRRKNIPSISFFPDGAIRSIYLEEQNVVSTPIGAYPAEFVTFYPSGKLCRLFPVNGKLSGYWTQEDESALCPELAFRLFWGAFKAKIIAMHFYESGALRSLALWPGESAVLRTNVGVLPVRGGAAFYEDGALESAEPAHPLPVETPVGVLTAFDSAALCIHGDDNSFSFFQSGEIRAVSTSSDQVEVILPDHTCVTYAPARVPDPLLEDRFVTVPLRLTFENGRVTLDNGQEKGTYSMVECCFRTIAGDGSSAFSLRQSPMTCGDCASCNLCDQGR